MTEIADKARTKDGGKGHADPRAEQRPPTSHTMKAARTAIPDPDGMDDAVLRWGRYVIEHLQPQPGDVILIKGPPADQGAEKRGKMARALHSLIREQGIEDYLIIRGPTQEVGIHQIDEETMRAHGYTRISDPDLAKLSTPTD